MINIVYKATNELTREVYIGVTSKSLDERIKDHIQKANKGSDYYFQEAIRTFGPDAFSWVQIDTALTMNELAEKESMYVLAFNSQLEGYNSDRGGGIKKNVYQYNMEIGNLLNSYPDLQSAGNAVNVDKKSISKACLGEVKSCAEFYWSYILKSNFKGEADKRKKQVFQFTFNGEFLASFKSVAEASRITNINKSSIAKCCRREYKYAGDYYWEYQN